MGTIFEWNNICLTEFDLSSKGLFVGEQEREEKNIA